MSRRLNIQGLARKSESLMRCMVADPGWVLVSSDISAGEPTVTTHYSGDVMYKAATFDLVGKPPYYRDDGTLMIGDIYLLAASRSPMGGKEAVRSAFNTMYDGKTFSELWVEDPDKITKGVLKKCRDLHKIAQLGIGYGMRPKKIKQTALEAGFEITLSEAKGFYAVYWDIFAGVATLGRKLEKLLAKQGYILNDFGYALYPDKPYKALNFLIQSSVSGLMHAFKALFFTAAPWARFVTVVHDEVIFAVPEDRLEETRRIFYECVDELNRQLNWTVKIRFGYKEGKDLYEAH